MSVTNADKDEVAYYEYEAWGSTMTEAEKSGVDSPCRFSTKQWHHALAFDGFGHELVPHGNR